MTVYAPGTEETDPKKQNRAIQAAAAAVTANTTSIATNTTDIATANTNIATNTTNIATNTSAISAAASALATLQASPIKASLGGDVALNNTANYFAGPSIAQGTTGTWFVSGTVTITDPSAAQIYCKLWDGTTVIASADNTVASGFISTISLSGYIASPAGNLRMDCRDITNTTGKILFNQTGNSKDSTISAYRIA